MLFPTWYRFENLRLSWVAGTILEEILQIFGLLSKISNWDFDEFSVLQVSPHAKLTNCNVV